MYVPLVNLYLLFKMSTRQSTPSTDSVASKPNLGFVPSERKVYDSTKQFDPIADQDMRLEELASLAATKKKITEQENVLKDSFLPLLLAELDDNEENPKIRHSVYHKVLVALTTRSTYRFSKELTKRRVELENALKDLKAEEQKAIRHGKATLVQTTRSIRFTG